MVRLNPRDEAKLKQYEELLEREPNALVFAALASFYARKYEFGRAVDVLRRGLKVFPNYFSARVLLAKCYIALDHFDNAQEEIRKVLSADPYNPSALGLMGDELRNRGRLTEARDYYQKILEFEPNSEEYAYKLELLDTIVDGGPFSAAEPSRPAAAVPAAAAAEPVAEAIPAVPSAGDEVSDDDGALIPPDVDAFTEADLHAIASFKETDVAEAEAEPAGHELATLTLAKIYEDQGLFLRARDVVQKVLDRDAGNDDARQALAHITDLINADESPTGASIVQLIQQVDTVAGVLERDDVELWEHTTAGVEEALVGFEEMTVAQAVAARAGVSAFDHFIVPADKPALWEMDLAGISPAGGENGADELWIDLPLAPVFDVDAVINFVDIKLRPQWGVSGSDEFALDSPVPYEPAAAVKRVEDIVINIKAAVAAKKQPAPASPPAETPEAVTTEEYAVRPEMYKPVKQLELEREPFKGDDDFLDWLDSIKLKEI